MEIESIEERVMKQMDKANKHSINGPYDPGERQTIKDAARLAYVFALADFRKEISDSVRKLEFDIGEKAGAYPK